MQAVSTWLTYGARPLGALLAGGLGTRVGVRAARVAGACLLVVPLVVLARSPLRALRQMPAPPSAPAGTNPTMGQPPAAAGPTVPAPGSAPAAEGSMDGGLP